MSKLRLKYHFNGYTHVSSSLFDQFGLTLRVVASNPNLVFLSVNRQTIILPDENKAALRNMLILHIRRMRVYRQTELEIDDPGVQEYIIATLHTLIAQLPKV